MPRMIRATLVATTAIASSVAAQRPLEFKANMRLQTDGSTSTGVVYFGGAKMRTEMTVDGQSVIVLMDHAAKSQLILMPSEKVYMQMPVGQGPVNIPVTGPTDPTNPCSGGSGATDCVKGPNESVNGYDAVRWDYTNQEGTRTRAWVSPKLRFAVKTQDDNGTKVEFTDIAEGAQPASLFAIPAGYTKMDMGGMGDMGGRGAGRAGRGANADPIAAAMAGLSAEDRAAMAAAMRGAGPRGAAQRGSAGPAGVTGSAWEKGKGWVVSVTVVGTTSSDKSSDLDRRREAYTGKFVGSIPLNYGTPGIGVPGAPGPMWTHMPAEGMGSPEALALPLSLSVETEMKGDWSYKGECGNYMGGGDAFTSVITMKGAAQKSVPIKKLEPELIGQSVFKVSPDLKTYDLLAGVSPIKTTEVTRTHKDLKSCKDKHAYATDTSATIVSEYGFTVDLKGLPLPAAVGVVTGSKKMPLYIGGRNMDATVTWTLTPIR